MSQTITVQISDQAYEVIRAHAQTSGVPEGKAVADTLEREFRNGGNVREPAAKEQERIARKRFERHFGEVDFGLPAGADNDGIDADLAREYAGAHEAT